MDIMKSLKITLIVLIFSLRFTSWGSIDFHVDDPTGNLEGDVTRGFVDITKVEIERNSIFTTIEIQVRDSFPEPATLLGMGMQFVCLFKTSGTDLYPKAIAELSERGWSASLLQQTTTTSSKSVSLDFFIQPNRVTLQIPNTLISTAEELQVSSSTANKPKWKPVTWNPVIILILNQNETVKESASY